jgi:hypothetical protein
MDEEGGIYYAQIRGFLQDQYCEKSAVITWLIPTTGSPKDKFDPSTYILGEVLTNTLGFYYVYLNYTCANMVKDVNYFVNRSTFVRATVGMHISHVQLLYAYHDMSYLQMSARYTQ